MAVDIDESPLFRQHRGDLTAFEAAWQEFVQSDRSTPDKVAAAAVTRSTKQSEIVDRLELVLNEDDLETMLTKLREITAQYNKK